MLQVKYYDPFTGDTITEDRVIEYTDYDKYNSKELKKIRYLTDNGEEKMVIVSIEHVLVVTDSDE